jgi:tetratricopeptide (TPR) repeat protein
MNIVKKVKTLLQEAELYHSQGLLYEAMAKYNDATELIQKNEQLKNKQGLIEGISKKINTLKKDISRIELAPKKPEMSTNIQDLIKKMSSFSPDLDEDAKALEAAVTLAKFGQFKRAISEFNTLLNKDSTRIPAAKNILRCHIALYSTDDAVNQYQRWLSEDSFHPEELDKLRVFLENQLKREGVETILPKTKEQIQQIPETPAAEPDKTDRAQVPETETADEEQQESAAENEDVLDVNSIGITVDNGPQKGSVYEFKVRFQLGKVVSLLIPSRDKDVVENFKIGSEIHDVQYYTNVGLFNGSGLVAAVKEITIGPLRGDFCVDIEVVVH